MHLIQRHFLNETEEQNRRVKPSIETSLTVDITRNMNEIELSLAKILAVPWAWYSHTWVAVS